MHVPTGVRRNCKDGPEMGYYREAVLFTDASKWSIGGFLHRNNPYGPPEQRGYPHGDAVPGHAYVGGHILVTLLGLRWIR